MPVGAKLGLSAGPALAIAQPTFLLVPLTPLARQTIQASYHDLPRSTCFLTSPPIVLFPSPRLATPPEPL